MAQWPPAPLRRKTMNDLPRYPAAEIGAVEDRFFTLRNFPLTDGTVMPEATIAYETYGRLAPPNGPNGGRNLVAVAGPSYGGYQAFQWAVAYPDFMDAIVPVNTAPWASINTGKQLAELRARLAGDPEWHGGRYYGKAACKAVLTDIRVE